MDLEAPLKPAGQSSSTPTRHVELEELTTDADFAKLTSSFPASALLVIYFHAPWAEPCKQMSTVLETLATTYTAQTPPSIAFVSLNAEALPEISEHFEVTAVPYIVLQKNGEVLEKISGGWEEWQHREFWRTSGTASNKACS